MINETRKLEKQWKGIKIIEKNERFINSSKKIFKSDKNLLKGRIIRKADIIPLRPCTRDSIFQQI